MTHEVVMKMFLELSREYKIRDVSLSFFDEECKCGARCDIGNRIIKVNTFQINRCNDDEIREILIHEFAHLSFGKRAYSIGHNKTFGKRVRTMGGRLTKDGITLELNN